MEKIIKLTESDLKRLANKIIEEQKKYEFVDEHPSYSELNVKIKELKKLMKTISKDIVGGKDYVHDYVIDKIS
jgi:uncharacterized protein YeeX (DUF496 family)